jgi:hypothetical protein
MPDVREYRVRLSKVGEEDWLVEWGGSSDTVPERMFFTDDVRDEMLLNSLRCYCAIENKPDPTAQSVVNGISQRGGIHTPARAVFVRSIVRREDGTFVLNYGYDAADASYGLTFTQDDLDRAVVSSDLIVWQVGAFLRFKGFRSLTAEAVAAVHSRSFRGF